MKLFDFKQRLETFPFWLEFPRLAPFYIHLLYKVQTNILLSEGLRPPVTINYFKIKSFRRLTKKSWLFVDSNPGQDRKTVRKFCLKWPKMLNWLNQPFLIWFRPGIYSVRPVQRLSPVASKLNYFKITFSLEDEFWSFTFENIKATHLPLILIYEKWYHEDDTRLVTLLFRDINLSSKFQKSATTSRCHQLHYFPISHLKYLILYFTVDLKNEIEVRNQWWNVFIKLRGFFKSCVFIISTLSGLRMHGS